MRYCQPQRPSRLQIDHQLVLGWDLHWQVGRLLAFEDAIDIASRAAKKIRIAWSEGHQSAIPREKSYLENRGHFVAGRLPNDGSSMAAPEAISPSDEAALLTPKRGYNRFDLGIATDRGDDRFHHQRMCSSFKRRKKIFCERGG